MNVDETPANTLANAPQAQAGQRSRARPSLSSSEGDRIPLPPQRKSSFNSKAKEASAQIASHKQTARVYGAASSSKNTPLVPREITVPKRDDDGKVRTQDDDTVTTVSSLGFSGNQKEEGTRESSRSRENGIPKYVFVDDNQSVASDITDGNSITSDDALHASGRTGEFSGSRDRWSSE